IFHLTQVTFAFNHWKIQRFCWIGQKLATSSLFLLPSFEFFLANLKSCTTQTARLAVSNPAFPLWRCGAKVGNRALKRYQTALKVILFRKKWSLTTNLPLNSVEL
ncbi:MAG TPA: hypothetical protein VIJ25_10470, partial [Methylococcales bacterium]